MKHIATAVLLLTGVLHASSIRAQSDDSRPSDVTGESCMALLQDDPALKPLSGKLSFDLTKIQALSILGSRTKSNTKEKAALTHFSLEWEKCQNSIQVTDSDIAVPLGKLRSAYKLDFSSTLADLYAGSITYGEFAKLRAKQYTEYAAKVDSIIKDVALQKMAREVQASRQREESQRLEVLAKQQEAERVRQQEDDRQRRYVMDDAACRNEASSRPLPANSSQNSTTNCSSSGGQISCETRPSSGFAAGWALGAQIRAKRDYYPNCMVARGWTKADAPK